MIWVWLMQQDIDQISPIVKRPRARSISIAVSTSTAGQELQFIESPPLSSSQTSSTSSSSSVISTKLSSSPTTVMVQYRFIIGNLKKPRRRMGSWISTLGVAHTVSKRNTGNAVAVIEIAGDGSSGSPHRPDWKIRKLTLHFPHSNTARRFHFSGNVTIYCREEGCKLPQGAYFPINPDSRQCIDILFFQRGSVL